MTSRTDTTAIQAASARTDARRLIAGLPPLPGKPDYREDPADGPADRVRKAAARTEARRLLDGLPPLSDNPAAANEDPEIQAIREAAIAGKADRLETRIRYSRLEADLYRTKAERNRLHASRLKKPSYASKWIRAAEEAEAAAAGEDEYRARLEARLAEIREGGGR